MSEEIRTCAYCGAEKCEHSYHYARKFLGYKKGFSIKSENVSAQTTIGELKESLNEWVSRMSDDTPATWMFSITKRGAAIDPVPAPPSVTQKEGKE
jgi:hypothetical protein